MKRTAIVRRRAWAALAGALGLWTFFAVTKHSPTFRSFAPFDVDPYDVVGSFTFQIALAVAILNLVRLRLIERSGREERLAFVTRGIRVVAAAIAITMISDAIAIARSGVLAPRAAAEGAIWAAIAIFIIFSILLARADPAPASAPTADADEFGAIFRRPPFCHIDPQRRPVRFAAFVSAVAAIAVTAAQVAGEGPAPTVAQTIAVVIVFLTLEGSVVFAGVLTLGQWLGLLGSRGSSPG